jgi:hypothetical protein
MMASSSATTTLVGTVADLLPSIFTARMQRPPQCGKQHSTALSEIRARTSGQF